MSRGSAPESVAVAVMSIMRVRVCMRQRLMAVPVSVRDLNQFFRRVLVLVMLIVLMDVGVLERLVGMGVVVDVRCQQERPTAHSHQSQKCDGMNRFVEQEPGEDCCESGR